MKNNKGFTLVELIIVIAILAIIMLIAIPNFSGIQQRMQVRADKMTAAQIGKAVRLWYTEYKTDVAFKATVGESVSIWKTSGNVILSPDEDNDETTYKGCLPIQNKTITTQPISVIKKLDEYIDTSMAPKSLRALDGDGNKTTLVEPNQYYSACLVGSGTAEKVVVCISDIEFPIIPSDTEGIVVGYTGDGMMRRPIEFTDEDILESFNNTVAYIEP